ncbi:unnamed protein product, partial [Closterium sp. NIES-54]
ERFDDAALAEDGCSCSWRSWSWRSGSCRSRRWPRRGGLSGECFDDAVLSDCHLCYCWCDATAAKLPLPAMATTTVLCKRQPSVQESLLPQQLREWSIWWGSPGGGASRARAGGAGASGPRTPWGATTGGTFEPTPAGSAAGRCGGSGGGQQQQQRPPETLSPQQLCEWAVQWGSPGGGGFRGNRTGDVEAPGGIEAASLGAFHSASARAEPEEALHTFTLHSGASRCFFRDSTTVTPLTAPVPVTLADPSGGPVVARGATVLPSLPPLLRSLAPPCLPCVEGRQRVAPHSSFPPTIAPLQTLHMDVWGPARVTRQGGERYFLLVVVNYMRYTTVFPLQSKAEVRSVLIRWIRLALGSGGTFRSCSCTLSEVVSFPPGFSWTFVVLRASASQTSPTLRWTGEIGDVSNFRFYHPGSRRVLSSRNVTFYESVCFYRLHLHRSSPVPLSPLSLVVDPPPVDPTPLVEPLELSCDTSGPAEGVDPTVADIVAPRCSARLAVPPGFPPQPSSPPLQPVAVDFGAAGGGDTGGAASGGAGSWGAECPRATGGAATGGTVVGGAGGASAGGTGARRQETLSSERLCKWAVRWGILGGGAGRDGAGGTGRTVLGVGRAGGTGAGGTGAGGTGDVGALAGGPGSPGRTGVGGARGTGSGGASAGVGGTGGADTVKMLYCSLCVGYSGVAHKGYNPIRLSAFATVEDLVTHLRTSDARYRAALPAEFLDKNPPPMYITLYFIVTRLPDSLRDVRDHFLTLHPTALTVALLEQHLLAAETSVVAVGAARRTPRTPFFEGCSPSPLAPSYASTAAVDILGAEDVGAASAFSGKRRNSKGKGGRSGGGGSGGGGGAGSGDGGGSVGGGSSGSGGGSGGLGGGSGGSSGGGGSGSSGSGGSRGGAVPRGGSGGGQRQLQHRRNETPSPQQLCIEVAALPCTLPAEALHTFTLDSSASCCFFRDSTTLTPLPAPVPVRLADPSGGPVLARSSTVLPCPAVPSGSLSGLHPPSFSTNLVSTAALQDAMVTTTTLGGQRVSISTCTRVGRHLATFTCRPGSSLYTLATKPSLVATSSQVSASSPVAPPCSCRLLSHQTLLWHHRLGHPSLPRLRGMHSRLLVSGLPRSLPPFAPSPAPLYLPCIEERQRAAPHSSLFPPTTAPLQTLHMDVWGPARVSGQGFCLQLRERFREDLPVLRLHSDRGGEFSFDLLRDFCRGEGILLSFTHPASPQQNGIAERRIGLVMEVAHTSMIHVAAPHSVWVFAVQYACISSTFWPRVSLPETSPTLHWTGKVGDASVYRVWGSRVFVRDTSADKLSVRAILCVFFGFVPDAPGWQFYHPTSHRVFPSQDVTFDESVPIHSLFPYRSAPLPPPLLFLAPGPPPVDPLPLMGHAPSGVSQVDPLLVMWRFWSSRSWRSRSRRLPSQRSRSSRCGGGAESEGAKSGGAEPRGTASSGGPAGASPRLSPQPEPLSPQQLCKWFARRTRVRRGAAGAGDSAVGGTGAGGVGATSLGGAGVPAGAGGHGGAGAAGLGGVLIGGTGAAGADGAGGAGAGDLGASGPGAGGTVVVDHGARGIGAARAGGVGGARAGGAGAGGAGAGDPGAGGVRAGGAGATDRRARGAGARGAASRSTIARGTVQRRPFFVPPPPSSMPPCDSDLRQVLCLPSSTGLPPSLLSPPPR